MADSPKDPLEQSQHQSQDNPQTPARVGGGLILPEQVLPPNLFILPINGPIAFPTLLAPLLVSQPRYVAMIEEAINRQRMIGLLLTQTGEVKEDTKPEDLFNL